VGDPPDNLILIYPSRADGKIDRIAMRLERIERRLDFGPA
jgi:hypothetical protein